MRSEHQAGQRPRGQRFTEQCQQNAHRDADATGHEQRAGRQLQGVGQARRDDGGHRHVLDHRLAKIEAGNLLQEGQVLHHQRAIKTQGVSHRGDVRLGGGFRHQQVGRVAGETCQEKDQADHPEQGQDDLTQAPEQKAPHGGTWPALNP